MNNIKIQKEELLRAIHYFAINILPKIIGYIMLITPIKRLFLNENELMMFNVLNLPESYFIFLGIMALAAVYLIKK
jgi:hypothetical protein